jgi:hypothetical protein
MSNSDLFGTLLGLGLFVWVVDEMGHRHKVYVKNDAEKRRLIAKNKALREKLAKKNKRSVKK